MTLKSVHRRGRSMARVVAKEGGVLGGKSQLSIKQESWVKTGW